MIGNRSVGFDKYPFILLNLSLPCLAAMQGAILDNNSVERYRLAARGYGIWLNHRPSDRSDRASNGRLWEQASNTVNAPKITATIKVTTTAM